MSRQEGSAHESCMEHRSMGVQVKASLFIGSLVFSGVFYQVFIQLPNLKYDITQQLNDQKMQVLDLQKDRQAMERRLSWLESKLNKE